MCWFLYKTLLATLDLDVRSDMIKALRSAGDTPRDYSACIGNYEGFDSAAANVDTPTIQLKTHVLSDDARTS